jgi:hypothetical protein
MMRGDASARRRDAVMPTSVYGNADRVNRFETAKPGSP